MFKNCSLLIALILAVAVAANVIPRGIEERASRVNNTFYVGNNLFIGNRTGDDWLHRTDTVFQAAVPSKVVSTTLRITTYFNVTHIAAIDLANYAPFGAYPTLIGGGPGQRNTTLLFTSKIGQSVNFTVSTYVKY